MTQEIPLTGGNVSAGVVRVGDTVRRPAGPWTPAVHALLEHLHGVGFHGAPRPLGIDERGREVLEFVPGEAAPDAFGRLGPADGLTRAGRLIRDFHDAVAGFVPPAGARWQTLVPCDGDEIVAHHDLAPWNLVLGPRWVFIDWDAAAPGSRLEDLAYAAHAFVPLSADASLRGAGPDRRLRVFVDGYGLDDAGRKALVPLLGRRTRAMHDFLAERSAAGVQPWVRLWQEGHGAVWAADAEYVDGRAERWERALLS